MHIILKKKRDESQPAIDTLCDNCSAIYDLMDCTTCSCGKILCPDCTCENSNKNTLKPETSLLQRYQPIRIYGQRNAPLARSSFTQFKSDQSS